MTVTDGIPPFLIGNNVTVTCATGHAFSVNLTLNSTDRVVASQILSCLDEPASAVGHWTQLTGNCTGKLHYENTPMYYTEILKVIKKNIFFHQKNFDIFHIFAQNVDCGYTLEPPRRGGSNMYPQSMFWSKNKKKRYTPAYPSFTYTSGVLGGIHYTDMFS